MTKRMATTVMFVTCLCTGAALAHSGARDSVDPRALHDYRTITRHALIACGSAFAPRQAAMRLAAPAGEFHNCVVKARLDVARKLDEAIRGLQGEDCVAALRRYNAAFMKALTGIEPMLGESPLAYEQRQVSLFHAMAHAWGRFEMAESFAD